MLNIRILRFVSLLYIIVHSGRCSVSNNDLKTEVTALVEEMLQEYKLTTEHLQLEVSRLSYLVANQQDTISTLEHKINFLTENKDTTDGSEKQNSGQDSPIRDDSAMIENEKNLLGHKSNVKHETNQQMTLKGKSTDYVKDAVQMHEPSSYRKRQLRENIAFCAYLDHDGVHMGIGQVIKYNQILLNDGSGYNTYTGIFAAPATGVYLFTFSFNSFSGKTEIRLVIDGANVVGSVVDHPEHTGHLTAGNTAIIHVTRGQAVWIEPYFVGD